MLNYQRVYIYNYIYIWLSIHNIYTCVYITHMTTLWWMVSFETGLFHHRQVHADPTNPIHTEPTSTFAFSLRYPLMQGNQLRTLSSVLRHQKGLKIVHQNNAFEIPQWKSPCPPFSENMVYLKIHEWQCRGVDIHHVQRHFKRFWLIHPMSRICLSLKGITQNMVEHAYMYIYILCNYICIYRYIKNHQPDVRKKLGHHSMPNMDILWYS